MTINIKHIYKIVRKFLFSWCNKEFLIFLFFLALSSIFWLMMTLNETYEQEICIPAKLTGIPENAVITTPMEDTVRVTVKDKGFVLAMYMFGNEIRPIKINFSTYANSQTGYGAVPLADLQKMANQRFGGISRITAVKPDKLDFYFNFGQKKVVPVRLKGIIVPSKTYYLARTRIWPETVTIYASKKILDSVRYVTTEPLHIEGFTDTIVSTVRLAQIKGVKTTPLSVRIGLYPDILTEESVEVPIQAIGMPEGKTLRTFPSRVKVKFNVGAATFRDIAPQQFTVVVDYRDIVANPSNKCSLTLRSVPHGVRNAHVEIGQVDYLIEQQ